MPAFCLTLTQYPNCKTIFIITRKITCGHFTVLSCVMTLWLRQQINKKGNHFSMEASLLTQWNVTFGVIFVPDDCAKTNFRFNTCLIYCNNDWLKISFYNWITLKKWSPCGPQMVNYWLPNGHLSSPSGQLVVVTAWFLMGFQF